jgi:hypothetical protein
MKTSRDQEFMDSGFDFKNGFNQSLFKGFQEIYDLIIDIHASGIIL